MTWESEYLCLMREILNDGEKRGDRTGVGTKSLFGKRLQVDLSKGFPAVTTKKLWFHGVAVELGWMLSGDTNVKSLQSKGVHIWDEWADEDGELGPVYGAQWRNWGGTGIDQVKDLLHSLTVRPDSRRHILSSWNVADLEEMSLPPCHVMAQFYVRDGCILDCHMYQRSADYFLGVPFNVAQYALLTHVIGAHLGYIAGKLTISFGDAHIYLNHIEQCERQLSRDPYAPPVLHVPNEIRRDALKDMSLNPTLCSLQNYQHHPAIKAEIAV